MCPHKQAQPKNWDGVFDLLVKEFTAYTHPRRLMIMRELAAKKRCKSGGLIQAVRLSPLALQRHLDKLSRRGLVVSRSEGTWEVVRDEVPPCRRRLQQMVLGAVNLE
ncbi:MAG: ArsR family transcriptional regulator [Verrucomicrobiae bacterium]|nr:ArsR family transcriptional regulator [Verrucomicrobiae bacterium]